ncbi:MAG: class I SAM-dependent methyltransferase, partial [Wenzhouxiangella sp.]
MTTDVLIGPWTEYDGLLERAAAFKTKLTSLKNAPPAADRTWYAYDILANLWHLRAMIQQVPAAFVENMQSGRIADIGAADGDLSFLFASLGLEVDLIDWPQANWNGLTGARAMKDRLNDSRVSINEIDLDSQFTLPSEHYNLVFFLGILYHLKNPYFALEKLARHSRYCFLSTRVARLAADREVPMHKAPMAYLLDPTECNNDSTNYWIFSP